METLDPQLDPNSSEFSGLKQVKLCAEGSGETQQVSVLVTELKLLSDSGGSSTRVFCTVGQSRCYRSRAEHLKSRYLHCDTPYPGNSEQEGRPLTAGVYRHGN